MPWRRAAEGDRRTFIDMYGTRRQPRPVRAAALAGLALFLIACGGTGTDSRPPMPDVTTTTTEAGGGGSTRGGPTTTPATTPATPATTAATTEASTAPVPTDPPTVDLTVPPIRNGQLPVVVPPQPDPGGVIVIAGELPLFLGGGTCEQLDGDTYLSIPATVGAPPPYASLVIYGGEGPQRAATLVWATGPQNTDGAVTPAVDGIVVTVLGDGFSGSFEGTAMRGAETAPVQVPIPVSGSFSCVDAPVRVLGDHPLDLTSARCTSGPFEAWAGTAGSNAFRMVTEAQPQPDGSYRGAITWRVRGVVYVSDLLRVTAHPGGTSVSYAGTANAPDGTTFEVSGTVNCLTGA